MNHNILFYLLIIILHPINVIAQKSIPLFNQKNLRGWYAFEPETGKHQQGLEVLQLKIK